MHVATIGLDLAKTCFQVHGIEGTGRGAGDYSGSLRSCNLAWSPPAGGSTPNLFGLPPTIAIVRNGGPLMPSRLGNQQHGIAMPPNAPFYWAW